MKSKNKETTLHDLLILKLRSLYDIEQELVKALPKMAKAATDPELKKGFQDHLAETKNQVRRLEESFKILGEKAVKIKVEAIRGLAQDAKWIMENIKNKNALDAALIPAASYVERYETAGYSAAIEWAEEMEHTSVAALLAISLDEEVKADEKLIKLAKSKINQKVTAMLLDC
jgi:ferritin-like metal-binding protein YciE